MRMIRIYYYWGCFFNHVLSEYVLLESSIKNR